MRADLKGPAIVVHGGAGGAKTWEDGCRRAAGAGLLPLVTGGESLHAVVAAVVVLEDDGRFNAGCGSELGLDGVTIEMDASVMDTRGRLGAVACIEKVRNPVLVARAVADTPHCLMAGEGALRLARKLGHKPFYSVTGAARKTHADMLRQLESDKSAMPGVDNADYRRYWNYACDTVGAVARDGAGHFAVAGSTGGAAPALLGRVGDTAVVGSGYYAGPHGAIAATGVGEHIMRHMLAREVYQWIAGGMALAQALQRGVDLIDTTIDVGLIGVTRTEEGACSNRDMPYAVARHG
jgi:L-asparaginase/beta-aspartyl-peptidase (threonine type)